MLLAVACALIAAFKDALARGDNADIAQLKSEVQAFASQFYMCGFNHLIHNSGTQ